ncbi:hypothetical protein [Gordonia sp. NB41Y]|uniref:hypothetical protein n=1 Tax=Gordonia sp. NB41Y TaxID=875808 RepID=UPI0002BFE43D|nr:hypothetical protein [Gordonia sp. NB41Y]EMP10017.1 hypothetical protein ISGA_1584 [Gordonia sp. NB41Y]WLP90238.1 hypothetical protein Q9K23_22435 [Gordonia sp. NB41Y]
MTNPPDWAIKAAGAALSRAEIFDDRVTADRARILAWAEALATYGIEQGDAIAAVTAHYQRAGADTPKPGDVIAEARKIRAERAEREKAEAMSALPTAAVPPDRQLGGLPIANVDGEPIWDAYEEHGAISRICPTCDAQPNEGCVNLATGGDRKIPCVARLKAPRGAA